MHGQVTVWKTTRDVSNHDDTKFYQVAKLDCHSLYLKSEIWFCVLSEIQGLR